MKILCLPRGQSWLPQLVSRLTSYTAKFDEPPPPECKVPRDGGLGVGRPSSQVIPPKSCSGGAWGLHLTPLRPGSKTPCPAGKAGNKWPFSAPGRTLEGKKVQQTPRPISLTTTNKSFFFPLLLLFFSIYLKLFYPLSYFLHVLYIPITLDKNCSKTVEYAPKGVDYISVTVNRDLG